MYLSQLERIHVNMKRYNKSITASSSMGTKGIVSSLYTEVGSRLDPKECYVMNSGNGTTYILFDDPDMDDIQLFELEISPGDCVAIGEDEIVQTVLDSWGD